jgi:O-antigen/teichoic acid export membrane protein
MMQLSYNAFVKALAFVLGKVIALVTIPLISNALGLELYGKYNHLLTFAGYGLVLINWGFLAKGIREIASNNKNTEDVVHEIVSTRLVLWLISSIILVALMLVVYQNIEALLLISLALIANFAQAINLDFYFYAKKNTVIPSLSRLAGQILFLILLIGFIKSSDDIYYLFFFLILLQFLEAIINYLYSNRVLKIAKISLNFRKSFTVLKKNLHLGFGAKTSFLTFSIPILLIPYFYNNEVLGAYMIAYKVFLLMTGVFSIGTLVLSPYVVKYIEERNDKILKIFRRAILAFFIIGFLGGSIIYIFHEYLIEYFFDEEFRSANQYFFSFMYVLVPIWGIYTCMVIFINNLILDRLYSAVSLVQLVIIGILTPVLLYFDLLIHTTYLIAFMTFISAVIYFKTIITKLRGNTH